MSAQRAGWALNSGAKWSVFSYLVQKGPLISFDPISKDTWNKNKPQGEETIVETALARPVFSEESLSLTNFYEVEFLHTNFISTICSQTFKKKA